MNERIETLIDDAKLTPVYEMFQDELKQFAVSIVEDCIQLVIDTPGISWDDVETIEKVIHEYFGVE